MPAKNPARVLRHSKVFTADGGTAWVTRNGGMFIEPVHRPDDFTLSITLSPADYKLLEVLHDDVAAYIHRLVVTHVSGLRKSAQINAQRKKNV